MDKEKALENVSLVFKGKPIENDSLFLSDVIIGGHWSWTIIPLQREIYDEINNTGKLTIIRNIELRNNIAKLYADIKLREVVGLSRNGEYVKIVYGLVPYETESRLKENLSHSEQRKIVETVINSNLNQTMIFEQNRASFLKVMWNRIEDRIALVKAEIKLEMKK